MERKIIMNIAIAEAIRMYEDAVNVAEDNFKDFRNAYVKAKEEMADGYNGEMIILDSEDGKSDFIIDPCSEKGKIIMEVWDAMLNEEAA